MSLELYLIRHGETEWSSSGRHTGSTDIPLTRLGEEHAAWLSKRLADAGFTHVFTSPRSRARRTCELAGWGAAATVDPDLAEWDYGDYEGMRSGEILKARPAWNLFRDGCPKVNRRPRFRIGPIACWGAFGRSTAMWRSSRTGTLDGSSERAGSGSRSRTRAVSSWTQPRSASSARSTEVPSSSCGTSGRPNGRDARLAGDQPGPGDVWPPSLIGVANLYSMSQGK
jgi:hypothetical protein